MPMDEVVLTSIWMALATECERADALRNGFVFIMDLSQAGWHNFDVRVNRELSSVFSVRVWLG